MRLLLALILACLAPPCILSQTYTISTIAGGGLPQNVQGTSADLNGTWGVAVDAAGNVFLTGNNVVFRLDSASGVLAVVAGNGTFGFSGDNGPATSAQLGVPLGVAVDGAGNLYIADSGNQRIRMVSNGVITTVAGGGSSIGDHGPATSAQLNNPAGVAVDTAGNLYIADSGNQRIREVSNGVISTVAGNGTQGFSGDNGPATSSQLSRPEAVAVDAAGNLYIADLPNQRIRKVSNGVISTIAGNGTLGFSGDNGPATSAQLNDPLGVAVDAAGNLYIADSGNGRIRMVSNGVITTVAGNGTLGFAGDNGPAGSSQLYYPAGVAVDAAGNVYIADSDNHRIRKVSNGVIATVAGGGSSIGDNGPATSAQLYGPGGVGVDAAGNLYIADSGNQRIRQVSNGVISTVAGNGTAGFSGDSGPATSAQLNDPDDVTVDAAGNIYIADSGNNRVRNVSNGVIATVAGNGTFQFGGDNGPATSAQLDGPEGVTVDAFGTLYIADSDNNRIRKVSNGVISTVAGNGTYGFSGDNGPATSAQLNSPSGVAVDAAGNIYIADSGNGRIREVSNGVITTVAGNGTVGFSGDSGPASGAQLNDPLGVAVDGTGNLYIANSGDGRIRKVSNGVITTVAGNGTVGFGGDNGPATSAMLSLSGLAVDSAGNVYASDNLNNRIRLLTPSGPSCSASVSPTVFTSSAAGGNLTIAIQTNTSCPWAVQNLLPWITNSGSPVSTGPATITLVVASNPGGARSAQVSVAGITVMVSQAASGPLVISSGGVVNGASYTGPVAPGSIATIFGNFLLAAPSSVSSFPIPTSLAGLSFQFGGAPLAPLFYADLGQVNMQIPWELSGQSQATVTAINGSQSSAPQTVSLATYAPGIFAVNGGGTGQGAILDSSSRLVDETNPATAGSTVVQIYCTGLGPVTNQPATGSPSPVAPLAQTTAQPSIMIGGVQATVQFSGLTPGSVGLYQVNAQVPANISAGTAVPVVMSMGGVQSNTVTIAVQ